MVQVSGYVQDSNGNALPNAEVYFSDSAGVLLSGGQGTTADLSGYYDMQGDGNFITASYTGYSKQTFPITDAMTQFANFKLSEGIDLPQVVIKATSHWKGILAIFLLIATAVFIFYPGNYSKA